ncbi:helix-turn-helix transcriptional regulator [Shouchella clausii]|uniref:Repressor protein n=3 Tax=Shouchella TaxID=2893057 RepID=Q5WGW9_SHOC1|nr:MULTISPECIES: helix-turn-helix transcriptional regulator [Shouchella]MDO7283104.1 helix-turn-helix transcriptional regulator [Shouchella clausii]MDO7303201.1 helix-turn-helix transcriptional regulator [Shouchella clausii]MDP0462899.1 helix-turn-helix transcriptional regulator [Shouchella rhizosphaerae]MDP5257606.1 helix-turn-helix transcriptional regulator [Shouchella clausii]MDP5264977.1 helix-turn-helix transcriptional regulator [Shouchella clausii]
MIVLQRETLKKVRLEHQMTLEAVAKKINVSTPFYWQIENGKRGLSYELAYRIAAVFSLKPDDLFFDDVLTNDLQNGKETKNDKSQSNK